MNEENKKRHSTGFFKVIGGMIVGIMIAGFFALIVGVLIMALWNWLMPAIFGLGTISFWQGFGIALLARLLFGGMGHQNGQSQKTKIKQDMGHIHRQKFNWKLDEVYEEWWAAEGAKSFEDYMKRKDCKDGKESE